MNDPDDVMATVFDALKPFDPSDAAITSIYFDNPSLDLYLGRLEKTEGAQAIRLRWYGPVDTPTIFVERKTHREDWTGEKSVKARFPIKEHQVNDYLAGRFDMTETFEAVRKRGKKSDKEVDAMIQLAREVQEAVKNKDLQPGTHLSPVLTSVFPRVSSETDPIVLVSHEDFLQQNGFPTPRRRQSPHFFRHSTLTRARGLVPVYVAQCTHRRPRRR